MKLVPYWKQGWRFISVRCAVALGIWNMVPDVLMNFVSDHANIAVSAILLAGTIIGPFLQQDKVKEADHGDE